MFWDRQVDSALIKLKLNVQAPVRVELWDGRTVDLGEPRLTLRLKGRRAAAAFKRPTMLALAEAYINGEADIEGDLREAIRAAEAISRSVAPALFQSEGPTNERHTRRNNMASMQQP